MLTKEVDQETPELTERSEEVRMKSKMEKPHGQMK